MNGSISEEWQNRRSILLNALRGGLVSLAAFLPGMFEEKPLWLAYLPVPAVAFTLWFAVATISQIVAFQQPANHPHWPQVKKAAWNTVAVSAVLGLACNLLLGFFPQYKVNAYLILAGIAVVSLIKTLSVVVNTEKEQSR